MSAVESIAQTVAGLRHLQLISALIETEPLDRQGQVGVGKFYDEAKIKGIARHNVTNDLEALRDQDWIWFEASSAGIQTVNLKQPGIDVAQEFDALRRDRRRRVRELRKELLNWLYDLYLDGRQAKEMDYFLTTSKNKYFGDPYTPKEIEREAVWLLTEGLIAGSQSFDPGLASPTITNKGIAVMEQDSSPAPAPRGGDIYNIHNTGALNWAHNSSKVTQSNTLTQPQVEQVERTLGSVRAMLNPQFIGVTEDVAAEGQVIIGEVEAEIHSSAPNGGFVCTERR